jgi:hypothetical protein
MKLKLIIPVLICLLCAVTIALVLAVQNNHALIKTNALLHTKLEERDIELGAYRIDEAKKEVHDRRTWGEFDASELLIFWRLYKYKGRELWLPAFYTDTVDTLDSEGVK